MASGQFTTQTTVLTRAETEVAAVHASIGNRMTALQAALATMLRGWQGHGADGANALITRVHADGELLNKALDGIAKALGQSGRNYDKTDTSTHSDLSGMAARLSGGISR